MDYSELSDFEINCLVAITIEPRLGYADDDLVTEKENGAANFRLCNAIGDDLDAGTYNYCNSWADIGPIIEEYRIGILLGSESNRVVAQGPKGDPFVALEGRDKVKRAACIVFLKLNSTE